VTTLKDGLSKESRIYIAGHKGLVGSAIWRHLQSQGFENLIGLSSQELDLKDREKTVKTIVQVRPDVVIMAAARVGGILANSKNPVGFINDNLRIQMNVFDGALASGVDRLLFLGSSCIYPKFAPQPIKEEYLLTGPLEPTNEPYALAKIAGIVQIQSYRREFGRNWISVMPPNLYGPGDRFDLETSHVIPAMLRKFHESKIAGREAITLWGTGSPRREFLHVDDLAIACLHLLNTYNDSSPINIGWGKDITIKHLAEKIAGIVQFEGKINWDETKPDGVPQKILDITRINKLGWQPSIDLTEGLKKTLDWYQNVRPEVSESI
jgi:GDP-L-fucose synthase